MALTLFSVGPSLVACPTKDAKTNALPLSLLWTQAVCRSNALKIGTEEYFKRTTREMNSIAWNITEADDTHYSNTSAGTTSSKAVLDIAGKYLLADQLKSLQATFDALSSNNPGSKLSNFVETWWKNRGDAAQGTVFAAAPVGASSFGPTATTLSYFCFNARFDSWQSFFVSNVSAQTSLTSQHVQLTLNTDLWSQIQDTMAKKLGKAAIDSIQRIDI